MRRPGFTIIELCIVVGLIAILSTALAAMLAYLYSGHRVLRSEMDADADGDRAVAVLRHHLACGGRTHLDRDNQGAHLGDGTWLHLEAGHLVLHGRQGVRPLFPERVTEFSVVRLGTDLSMTVCVEIPSARLHQTPTVRRLVYDL